MADSTETVKKTIEQATATAKVQGEQFKAQAEQFQAKGTQALREGMEKTSASIAELSAQSKQNLEALTASATAAQKGAEALSAQALSYGKTSWESGVAAAQSLSSARSVQELLELQTSWAKSATETYMSNLTRMTDVFTASVKDSFKPINERVSASVEKFQAAR